MNNIEQTIFAAVGKNEERFEIVCTIANSLEIELGEALFVAMTHKYDLSAALLANMKQVSAQETENYLTF